MVYYHKETINRRIDLSPMFPQHIELDRWRCVLSDISNRSIYGGLPLGSRVGNEVGAALGFCGRCLLVLFWRGCLRTSGRLGGSSRCVLASAAAALAATAAFNQYCCFTVLILNSSSVLISSRHLLCSISLRMSALAARL
jgi:hypothetical protein